MHQSDEPHDLLLFDLDGTISDPVEGIARSFNYALSHFGYSTFERNELARYIGPPLDRTFATLIQSTEAEVVNALVAKYRERYSEIGFSENVLYSGVRESLTALHETGARLAVCTSKRVDFAKRILEMFELSDMFCFVNGGDVGIEKWQQIAELREQGLVTPSTLMIGDRAVDLTAAHRNGLTSAGVLWGYGSLPELEAENPRYIFQSPSQLVLLGNLGSALRDGTARNNG